MKRKLFFILALLAVALNLGLGSWGLTESSEARYAEISREMVKSGDYLQPKLLGVNHFDKPPMTYYITALGYEIFGVNEFGARFFLGIALLFQIFLIFKIGLLLFKNEKTAFASALIYLSFPIVLVAARNLTTDCYLTTFVLWGIYLWLQHKNDKSKLYFYGFFIVLALGFLTKGPVVLLPVLAFIACWKIVKRDRLKIDIHSVLGIILFLVIASSWFVVVIIDKPELWDYFLIDQLFKRATAAQKFHRAKSAWYYFAYAPLVGLPWFFFILFKSLKRFKSIYKKHQTEVILGATFVFLLLVFSLFSSKLILYILPIYGFLALIGGSLIGKLLEKTLKVFNKIYGGLFILLGIGIVFCTFLKSINLNWFAAILLFLFVVGSAIFIFEYANFSKRNRLLCLGLGFSLSILFFFTVFSAGNPYKINSTKALAEFIKNEKGDELNRVITYDYLLPSLSFYLDKPLLSVSAGYYKSEQDLKFEEGNAYEKNYLNVKNQDDKQRFKSILNQQNNVLIIKKNNGFNKKGKSELKQFRHKKEFGKWFIYY